MQLSEVNLCVVTDPMKSVTKLGRNSNPNPPPPPLPLPAEAATAVEGLKRKYRETIEDHAQQLQSLQDMQEHILSEVQSLMKLAAQRGAGSGGAGPSS